MTNNSDNTNQHYTPAELDHIRREQQRRQQQPQQKQFNFNTLPPAPLPSSQQPAANPALAPPQRPVLAPTQRSQPQPTNLTMPPPTERPATEANPGEEGQRSQRHRRQEPAQGQGQRHGTAQRRPLYPWQDEDGVWHGPFNTVPPRFQELHREVRSQKIRRTAHKERQDGDPDPMPYGPPWAKAELRMEMTEAEIEFRNAYNDLASTACIDYRKRKNNASASRGRRKLKLQIAELERTVAERDAQIQRHRIWISQLEARTRDAESLARQNETLQNQVADLSRRLSGLALEPEQDGDRSSTRPPVTRPGQPLNVPQHPPSNHIQQQPHHQTARRLPLQLPLPRHEDQVRQAEQHRQWQLLGAGAGGGRGGRIGGVVFDSPGGGGGGGGSSDFAESSSMAEARARRVRSDAPPREITGPYHCNEDTDDDESSIFDMEI